MPPILQGSVLLLAAGIAFGAAEYFRQELAITCRREQGRPECRLVVHYRLAVTEFVFAAGDLVAAGHARREHRDAENDVSYTDHLVLTRRDGTTWASAHQDDASAVAGRLGAYLDDPAETDFAATASNRAYNLTIAAFLPIAVFTALDPERHWVISVIALAAVMAGYWLLR